MRLQLALDRVSLEYGLAIAQETAPFMDIIEIGTSLIKDFGTPAAVGAFRKSLPNHCLLADIKTNDQGAYEFEQAFRSGADIATVMGWASLATITACRETAVKAGKHYMIDLLETTPERLRELYVFSDAIFCVHLSTDSRTGDLEKRIQSFTFPEGSTIAAAGGIAYEQLPALVETGVDIAIVGGSITRAKDIRSEASRFHTAAHKGA